MKTTVAHLRRLIKEALDPNACPDCMGSGKAYVGLTGRDEGKLCSTCNGTGKIKQSSHQNVTNEEIAEENLLSVVNSYEELFVTWKLIDDKKTRDSVDMTCIKRRGGDIILYWDPRDNEYHDYETQKIIPVTVGDNVVNILDEFVVEWLSTHEPAGPLEP